MVTRLRSRAFRRGARARGRFPAALRNVSWRVGSDRRDRTRAAPTPPSRRCRPRVWTSVGLTAATWGSVKVTATLRGIRPGLGIPAGDDARLVSALGADDDGPVDVGARCLAAAKGVHHRGSATARSRMRSAATVVSSSLAASCQVFLTFRCVQPISTATRFTYSPDVLAAASVGSARSRAARRRRRPGPGRAHPQTGRRGRSRCRPAGACVRGDRDAAVRGRTEPQSAVPEVCLSKARSDQRWQGHSDAIPDVWDGNGGEAVDLDLHSQASRPGARGRSISVSTKWLK